MAMQPAQALRAYWPWLALLAALVLGYALLPVLTPFLLGALLAYMGNPLVERLQQLKFLSRTWAVAIVFLGLAGIVALLILILVPMLGRQLTDLYALTPQLLDWLQQSLLPWLQETLGLEEDVWEVDKLKQALSSQLEKAPNIAGMLLGVLSSSGMALVGWLTNLFLVPVVTFYLLRDWRLIVGKVQVLLPRREEPLVIRLTSECHEVLGAFMRGQLLVMLALAVVYALGLMLLGLKLGLLVGVLAGLASIVPYMGFIVGIGVALIAGLFQFGLDYLMLGGIVGVFLLGQVLESVALTPLLVGDRIGLHPVAVMFAILAGGQLFGFTGVLLALPVAAVLMVWVRFLYQRYRSSELYRQE
ncbi:AI-2E family transporter [Thiopseudomonas denitrificans]|uniref:Putative PurR-regulated permease PerM n=1 Tax=Thiopseudomonas denitrificans TaxID=1501432 RepID=A0A4V3D5D0_9GAMM|nr:putative PurR-regulated permease PerM [Thiopseudomonas denitrificans]